MRRTCFVILSVVVLLLLEYDSTTLTKSCSAIINYHYHHHVSHNITTDHSALLALKSHIISDLHSTTLTKNWSTDSSCCSWVGVICSTHHERVIALNLSYMGLIGTIPPHIGNLSFLVSLVLRNNSFNGSLPKEMSHLGRLKTIDLRFNNFAGGLPSWISKLHKLEELFLSYNSFTGTIPPSFSNISNLVALRLSANLLQGNIPQEIGDLVNLEVLLMESNQLTGSIPVTIFNISTLRIIVFSNNSLSGNLPRDICHGIPKIQVLYLGANKLSGSILSALHECSKLELMGLDDNKFSGIIPREIANLTLLQELYLGWNFLKGNIPQEIGNLWNLKVLSLNVLNLRGAIPESVFNLSKLETISIVSSHLSGKFPSNFGQGLPNLKTVYLGSNYLTGILPGSISNASELVTLDIGTNNLTGMIPNTLGNLGLLDTLNLPRNNFIMESSSSELSFITSLTNCRNLRILCLDDNSLNGYLPVSIGNFSTALQDIYARGNGIKGSISSEIGNLSNLIMLGLHGNELTGIIPKTIKRLSKLQGLSLSENSIGGYIPDDLCNLQNLDLLSLTGNQIYGVVPSCLGNITSLRQLFLSSNRLTSTLPIELGNLKDLLEFDVSNNSLSGHLPRELGNWKAVVQMDFSYNQFSGDIPNNLGQLQNMVNLSLSNNKLQGPIPGTFKYLISLEYMDLSNNNLSGVIPKSLEALLYLKYFNVSSNSLRGEIPSEGPFKSFTGQSFRLNKALCGAPRFQVPLCHTSNVHESKKNIRVLLAICISSVIASIILTYALVFIRQRRRSKVPFQTESPIIAPRRISYHELQQATDGFDESNLLGMGSFGSVYKGILTNGTFVAIKVFNLQVEGGFKSFDIECEVLRNLRHRNIVKVISCCSNLDFKALVLEYMPNGSLEKWLYSDDHFLDILQRIDIMIDVACALYYLHYSYFMPMVHCDIKPSNVLLDEDMVAHLSDFGITKLLGEGESTAQTMTLATFGYIAPEYGTEGLVSRKCDVYSYGIMLMEIFSRTKPSDERILGNMSLKHWINDSLPKSVIQVTDANLLKPNDGDVADKVQCVSSILKLALICSADSPDDRFNMKDVIIALKKIRLDFLANHEGLETSKAFRYGRGEDLTQPSDINTK